MISHSRRHCVVELQALPSRIGQIRRIVSAQLRHWQLDPLIDRAALGVTELLGNVHRHAQPSKVCTVEIELRLGRLTVSVADSDPRLPVLRAAGDLEELETCGRGLALVEAVSEAWGARQRTDGGTGKVVWFSLRAAPAMTPPTGTVRIPSKPVREVAPIVSVAVEPAAVITSVPVSASMQASMVASMPAASMPAATAAAGATGAGATASMPVTPVSASPPVAVGAEPG
ncbi:ATP-binding protein [Streptomyces sp. NPDC102278]|uniref:ATP-binding protein n=1 Tax=Streptomyces sp. NPDC102278 TaxID=3366152 RepID=UPI00381DCDFF